MNDTQKLKAAIFLKIATLKVLEEAVGKQVFFCS